MEKMEIIYSEKYHRTNIRFNEKPSEEVRNELKEEGWFYSSHLNIWYPSNKAAENSQKFSEYLKEKYYKNISPTENPDKVNKEEVKEELPINGTIQLESLLNDLRQQIEAQNKRITELEEQVINKNNTSYNSIEANTEPINTTDDKVIDEKKEPLITAIEPYQEEKVSNIKSTNNNWKEQPYYFYIRGASEFFNGSDNTIADNKFTAEQAIENLLRLNKQRNNNTSSYGIGITVPGTLDHGEDFNGIGVVEFQSLEENIYEVNDLFFSTGSDIIENKNYIDGLNALVEVAYKKGLAVKLPPQLQQINMERELREEMRRHAEIIANREDDLEYEEEYDNQEFDDENVINAEWNEYYDNVIPEDIRHDTIEIEPNDIIPNEEQESIQNQNIDKKEYLESAIINSIYDDIKASSENEIEDEDFDDMEASRGLVQLSDLTTSNSMLQDIFNRTLENNVQNFVDKSISDIDILETKIYIPSEFNMEGSEENLHVMVSYDSREISEDELLNRLNQQLQLFPNFKTDWYPLDIDKNGSIEEFLELKKSENSQQITDETKHKTNKEIVDLRNEAKSIIQKLENEITDEDIEILKKYEGAGGLKEENRTNSGILNEFYTPDALVEKVWKIVDYYSPNATTVLEPSSGVGRFANNRPNNLFTMFELDEVSSKINHILHPNASIINEPFQAQFFDEGKRALLPDYEQPKYDIVIGNPPYGSYNSEWKGKGEGKEFDRYEEYFIYRGLQALKNSNSVLAFVVPSGFLNNASDKAKRIIADTGILIDAYRLPENVFPTTSIGTDIIIMKPNDYSISFDDRLELISNNNWFKNNPDKILGEVKTRTNRFGKEEEYVIPHKGKNIQDELDKIDTLLASKEIEHHEADIVPEENYNEDFNSIENNETISTELEDDEIPEYVELTDDDVEIASMLIPKGQFETTVDYATEGEEQEFYKNIIKRTADTYRRINSDREILNEDGTHPLAFRYFFGKSEFFISEIDTNGIGFGYAVLNGDLDMSEFGSISIEEITSIEGMNMDYYVPRNTTIEAILYSEHPEHKFWFPNPNEREIFDPISKEQDIEIEEPEKKLVPKKKTAKKKWNITKSIGDTLSAEEFCEHYDKEYNKNEYNIWKSTNWEGKIELSKLSEEDIEYLKNSNEYIEQEKDNWVHKVLFASGDIYEKIQYQESLLELSRSDEDINRCKNNISILKSTMKDPITIDNIHFGILTTLAEDFKIEHVNELGLKEAINLRESFILWAKGQTLDNRTNRRDLDFSIANISREDFVDDIRWNDIVDYIDKISVKAEKITSYTKRNKTEAEIEEIKKNRKTEAELKKMARQETADKLFDKYIHNGLSKVDQERLTKEYNERFNSYVSPDYSQLPLYISGMSFYKGEKEFSLYEQQLKGISFLCNKGNGLLAYDVGVGKTAAGIVATINQIQSGRSRKPLIVVPNSVYSKWYTDIKQLFPDVIVNDLYNLNEESAEDYLDPENPHSLLLSSGSVSLITYEALKNITFNDNSIVNELYDDFSKLLSADFDGSEMQNAVTEEKIKNVIGVASQVENTQYFFFEDCGFDNITVDEAHNFKNLWTVPRPKTKGESNEFSGIPSGLPSNRALKLYAMTQLTQRHNDNRNVFLLTATPFTNSPLEVYSMLSYIGRQRLIESGLYSLRDFLNEFAKTKIELAVTPKGDVGTKQVMKSWRSLPALQNLLKEYIDKVTAEEAKIVRPRKYLENEKNPHVIKLDMNNIQKQIVKAEEERMTHAGSNSGDVLKAMNNMRVAMVAPALLNIEDYVDYGIVLPSKKDLIETSPKLKFICSLVTDLYKEEPDKGQFIYMPLGKAAHKYVKEYLIEQGIPKEAIEIINGETNNSVAKKEKISSLFNNKNEKLKILIGGKNTSEGIDLNGNTFVMYNLSLGWNPSETVQAEGRIWRQGNNQKIVHCIYPVMNDSIDALLYQKHDEKIARINYLWSYKGNDLNVEDINPEELKFDLIKDPKKRVRLILDEETKELKAESKKIELKQQALDELIDARTSINNRIKSTEENLIEYQDYKKSYVEQEKEVPEWINDEIKNDEKVIKNYKNQLQTVENKLTFMNLKTDDDISRQRESLANEKVRVQKDIDNVEKKLPDLLKEMEAKLKRQKLTALSIEKQKDLVKNKILSNMESDDEQGVQKNEVNSNQQELNMSESILTYSVNENHSLEQNNSKPIENEEYNYAEIFKPIDVTFPKYNPNIDMSDKLAKDYKANEGLFYRLINDYITKGINYNDEDFKTRRLPNVVSYTGFENKNISVSRQTLLDAKNIHDLSNDDILKSLDSLANPIAIAVTPDYGDMRESNLLFYSNYFKDGKPIVFSFGYDYEWDSIKLNRIEPLSERHKLYRLCKVLYQNDNKIDSWLSFTKEKSPYLELEAEEGETKKFSDYDKKYNDLAYIINVENDDRYLTPSQRIESEKERDKLVGPIIHGSPTGLWKAFKDFDERGVFDITGSKVDLEDGHLSLEGKFDLYNAMKIYRNKKFESFRYLFIDKNEGKVIDQLAISVHLPTCTPISIMDGKIAKNLEDAIDRAKERDCYIAIAHNHPSGSTEPSPEDISTTQHLQEIFDKRLGEGAFLGHIILDHNTFSYYTKETGWQFYNQEHSPNGEKRDRFLPEDNPYWFAEKIGHGYDLFEVAHEINDINTWSDDFTPVIFANADLRMSAIKLYRNDFFMNMNYESMHNRLQMDAINLGSIAAYPIVTESTYRKLSNQTKHLLEDQLKKCIEKNVFTDAAINGHSVAQKHYIKPGIFLKEPSKFEKIEVMSTWDKSINVDAFNNKKQPIHYMSMDK